MSYITPQELDGAVQPKLLRVLNGFIRCIRSVFYVHFFVGGSHNPDSYHYRGEAADGHIGRFVESRKPNDADIQIMAGNMRKLVDKENKTLFEQAIVARLRGMQGVGMYPHWKPAGGLHLDVRKYNISWVGLDRDKLQHELERQKTNQIYVYLR
jgi:hypothetical protein